MIPEIHKFYFDWKPDHCKAHERPNFTPTEQAEFTLAQVRDMLVQLEAFREALEDHINVLCKQLTNDNVTFKSMIATSHDEFVKAVNDEITKFENGMNAAYALQGEKVTDLEERVAALEREVNANG